MKISYRTHPILKNLHQGSLVDMPLLQSDIFLKNSKVEHLLKEHWRESKIAFNNEITMVSESFNEASNKSYDRLYPLFLEMIEDGLGYNLQGTYLMGDFVYMINYIRKDTIKNNTENRETIFVFLKTGEPVFYFRMVGANVKGWISQSAINGNIFKVKISTQKQIALLMHSAIVKCVLFSMFKTFADVETKFLPNGQKVKGIDCNYKNDTKLNITYLDSKWFTNLVKSDSFKVRGHFRLQPCGQSFKDRKLIWISDFEKHGYTAPAKVLSNQLVN